MATRDLDNQLSPLTLFYHWTIGLLMIGALAFGLYLETLASSPEKGVLVYIHKNVGLLILLLAISRIMWRWTNGFLTPLGTHKPWQTKTAYWVHVFLLIGTIAMPISGMMMSIGYACSQCVIPIFGIYDIGPLSERIMWIAAPGYFIHTIGSKILILAILLHAAAALKHHYWDGDGTLRRMFGRKV